MEQGVSWNINETLYQKVGYRTGLIRFPEENS